MYILPQRRNRKARWGPHFLVPLPGHHWAPCRASAQQIPFCLPGHDHHHYPSFLPTLHPRHRSLLFRFALQETFGMKQVSVLFGEGRVGFVKTMGSHVAILASNLLGSQNCSKLLALLLPSQVLGLKDCTTLPGNNKQSWFLATKITLMDFGDGSLGERTDNQRTQVGSWLWWQPSVIPALLQWDGKERTAWKITGRPAWSAHHSIAQQQK